MKSHIYGKNVTRTYSVDIERDAEGKIRCKPQLKIEEEKTTFRPIIGKGGEELVVDGEIGRNTSHSLIFYFGTKINIDENTEVNVERQIYRADLSAYIVHTDHILDEDDTNKEEMEVVLESAISEYNKTSIEADEEALAYCNLHKLDPASTDYDELTKLVHPGQCKIDYIEYPYAGFWRF